MKSQERFTKRGKGGFIRLAPPVPSYARGFEEPINLTLFEKSEDGARILRIKMTKAEALALSKRLHDVALCAED